MKKEKLIEIKKSLVALGLAGVMVSTAGCSNSETNTDRVSIPNEYSKVDKYYKTVVRDGNAQKLYKSENIYILYDKETYDISEYIYNERKILGGLGLEVELYNLNNLEMVVYSDGISKKNGYNQEYYSNILNNNYQFHMTDVSDYVEGVEAKEYYTLDEIKELESKILEGLKIINNAKGNQLIKSN